MTKRAAILLLAGSVLWMSCSRGGSLESRSLEIDVDLGSAQLVPGCPLEMVYRFQMSGDDQPLSHDYTVFVHFLDRHGNIVFTDDHQPPDGTTSWEPGTEVEYSRLFFAPKIPLDGVMAVDVGLYRVDTKEKLLLGGRGKDNRRRVGEVTLQAQGPDAVEYLEGFYDPEWLERDRAFMWRWSEKNAVCESRNPGGDGMLYLAAEAETRAHPDPLEVTVTVNGAEVSRLRFAQSGLEVHSLPVPAEVLGDGDLVEIGLQCDKTFVPAIAGLGEDERELGLRVFHVCLEAAR